MPATNGPQRAFAKVVNVSCSECGAAAKYRLGPDDTLNLRHACGFLPAFERREPSDASAGAESGS